LQQEEEGISTIQN